MTPVDYFPDMDMDHIELKEAKIAKGVMLAYNLTLEA